MLGLYVLAFTGAISGASIVTFEQVGQFNEPDQDFGQVEIYGNYLFAATPGNGWQVIDVSNPEFPTSVFRNPFESDVWGLRVQENELFVDLFDHFTVYDISSPSTPVFYGGSQRSFSLTGLPVYFHGYLAPDNQYHIARYSYAEATKTFTDTRRSVFGIPDMVTLLADPANDLLLGGSASGLHVLQYDSSRLDPFFVIGHASTNPVFSLCLTTNLAIAASGPKGIQVFDLSKPSAPLLLRTPGFFGAIYNVAAAGPVVYAANGAFGVWAIDISDPSQIKQIGRFNSAGNASDVCTSGDYVYVADGTNGVLVLKATLKPATPPTLTLLPPPAIYLHPHQDLSVTVAASGDEPLGFYWYRDNIVFANGPTPQLSIPDITPERQGRYKVLAANASGTAEAEFDVRIFGDPRLLVSAGPGSFRLDIRNGSELYPGISYQYLEIESSTNLINWESFLKNPARDYDYYSRDPAVPHLFFRLVEHTESVPAP
jgi:hypothetical protein